MRQVILLLVAVSLAHTRARSAGLPYCPPPSSKEGLRAWIDQCEDVVKDELGGGRRYGCLYFLELIEAQELAQYAYVITKRQNVRETNGSILGVPPSFLHAFLPTCPIYLLTSLSIHLPRYQPTYLPT